MLQQGSTKNYLYTLNRYDLLERQQEAIFLVKFVCVSTVCRGRRAANERTRAPTRRQSFLADRHVKRHLTARRTTFYRRNVICIRAREKDIYIRMPPQKQTRCISRITLSGRLRQSEPSQRKQQDTTLSGNNCRSRRLALTNNTFRSRLFCSRESPKKEKKNKTSNLRRRVDNDLINKCGRINDAFSTEGEGRSASNDAAAAAVTGLDLMK